MKSAGILLKTAEIAQASGPGKKEVGQALKRLKPNGRIELPKVYFLQPKQH